MKGILIRTSLMLLAGVLCPGCTHVVTVEVNGTQNKDAALPSHVTYSVLPVERVKNDPVFPIYAKMVAKKLDARDYKQSDAKTANLGVFLDYMVTEREVKMQGGGAVMAPGIGSYGMAGPSAGTASHTTYAIQLAIVIVDLVKSRSAGSAVEVWKGETKTMQSSNDLRQVAPMLIDAAFRHFGENTSKEIRHTFRDDDADVKTLQEVR
jgi:hypothetical protein